MEEIKTIEIESFEDYLVEDQTTLTKKFDFASSKIKICETLSNFELDKYYLIDSKVLYDNFVGSEGRHLITSGLVIGKITYKSETYCTFKFIKVANLGVMYPILDWQIDLYYDSTKRRFYKIVDNELLSQVNQYFTCVEKSYYNNISNINELSKEFNRFDNVFEIELFNDVKSKFEETLEFYYPGDYDFQLVSTIRANKGQVSDHVSKTAKYCLTIRFPEITIKNSKYATTKRSHIIRDLFVISYFDDTLSLLGVFGRRTTYTAAEYASSYLHSHLRQYKSDDIDLWCLGGESNPICKTARDMMLNPLNIKNLESYLLHISSMVRYESLEGTPYVHFEQIKATNKTEFNVETGSVINYLLNKLEPSDIPFKFTSDIFNPIEIDENNVKFKETLDKLCPENYKCIVENGKGYKLSKDSLDASSIKYSLSKFRPLWFRGDLIYTKLFEEAEEVVYKEEIHPYVLRDINKRLVKVANDLILNNNYYKLKYKLNESRNRKS